MQDFICSVQSNIAFALSLYTKKLIKLEENLADFQKYQVSDQIKGFRVFKWVGDREIIQTEKN